MLEQNSTLVRKTYKFVLFYDSTKGLCLKFQKNVFENISERAFILAYSLLGKEQELLFNEENPNITETLIKANFTRAIQFLNNRDVESNENLNIKPPNSNSPLSLRAIYLNSNQVKAISLNEEEILFVINIANHDLLNKLFEEEKYLSIRYLVKFNFTNALEAVFKCIKKQVSQTLLTHIDEMFNQFCTDNNTHNTLQNTKIFNLIINELKGIKSFEIILINCLKKNFLKLTKDQNFFYIEALLDGLSDEEFKKFVNTNLTFENKLNIGQNGFASLFNRILKHSNSKEKESLLSHNDYRIFKYIIANYNTEGIEGIFANIGDYFKEKLLFNNFDQLVKIVRSSNVDENIAFFSALFNNCSANLMAKILKYRDYAIYNHVLSSGYTRTLSFFLQQLNLENFEECLRGVNNNWQKLLKVINQNLYLELDILLKKSNELYKNAKTNPIKEKIIDIIQESNVTLFENNFYSIFQVLLSNLSEGERSNFLEHICFKNSESFFNKYFNSYSSEELTDKNSMPKNKVFGVILKYANKEIYEKFLNGSIAVPRFLILIDIYIDIIQTQNSALGYIFYLPVFNPSRDANILLEIDKLHKFELLDKLISNENFFKELGERLSTCIGRFKNIKKYNKYILVTAFILSYCNEENLRSFKEFWNNDNYLQQFYLTFYFEDVATSFVKDVFKASWMFYDLIQIKKIEVNTAFNIVEYILESKEKDFKPWRISKQGISVMNNANNEPIQLPIEIQKLITEKCIDISSLNIKEQNVFVKETHVKGVVSRDKNNLFYKTYREFEESKERSKIEKEQ
ncbi:MAG: hypothetical protein J0H68_01655 [Sphingobacteriia bacterium]|nr:hypothetical protein [Sphingobacteriia bacterium]